MEKRSDRKSKEPASGFFLEGFAGGSTNENVPEEYIESSTIRLDLAVRAFQTLAFVHVYEGAKVFWILRRRGEGSCCDEVGPAQFVLS